MNKNHIIWLSGLFEGEGCLAFTGKNSVTLSINMTDEDVVQRCFEITKFGKIFGPYIWGKEENKPMWCWIVTNPVEIEMLLPSMLPWLGVRRLKKAVETLERIKLVRRRGFCKNGHPMSGDNLYTSPKGQRQCRICLKKRDKKAWIKRKAKIIKT